MKRREFSKILGCSTDMWNKTLKGDRNLGYPRAKIASQVLNTVLDVWMDSERVLDRQAAWKNFSKEGKA